MSAKRYWFRGKRYGWGWVPCSWEGWGVLAGFVALVVAGRVCFPPSEYKAGFLAYVVALIVALVAICYAKGEPQKWRWGR